MATVSQNNPPRSNGNLLKIIIPAAIVLLLLVLVIANLGAIGTFLTDAFNWVFNYDARVNPDQIIDCRNNSGCSTVHAIIYSLIFFFVVVTGFAYTTLLERRVLALLQHRVGPNRVGPGGFLQPAADGVKLIFKEDIVPDGVYLMVYRLAPLIKTVPTLVVAAVIPFGPRILVPWFDGNIYRVPLGLADPNVGVLWLMAITSIGTYGVALAGWSSNNKYALLGSLRATAQMLSYELSLGLTMAVPIILAGSMSVGDIISQQRYIWEWYIFQNPLAALILFIALLAEVNRAPFDLPEAEQELTAGFMTEYSGMKFATFMMAEYLGMIGISLIFSALYLGGYQDGFGLVDGIPILGPLVMIGKVVLMLLIMIWIRGTLPRIRYDRLMSFGWKVMVPLALIAVAWTAISVIIADMYASPVVYGIVSTIFAVLVIGGFLLMQRRSGEPLLADAVTYEEDPLITGEQKGIGYMALQAVGGLIAIPFVLYDFTLKQLDNLSELGKEPETGTDVTPTEAAPARPARKPAGE